MRIQRYLPILIIAVILGALAYAQGWLDTSALPETNLPDEIRSQAAAPNNNIEDIAWLELDIELMNEDEIELEYRSSGDDERHARLKRDDRPDQREVTGQDAVDQTAAIVGAVPPLDTNEPLSLIQGVLDQLEISQSDVKEFELEYRLKDGTRGSVDLEIKDSIDDDDNDD